MSKTTPVRWWRDDATRYQSRPPFLNPPDRDLIISMIRVPVLEFRSLPVQLGLLRRSDETGIVVYRIS